MRETEKVLTLWILFTTGLHTPWFSTHRRAMYLHFPFFPGHPYGFLRCTLVKYTDVVPRLTL